MDNTLKQTQKLKFEELQGYLEIIKTLRLGRRFTNIFNELTQSNQGYEFPTKLRKGILKGERGLSEHLDILLKIAKDLLNQYPNIEFSQEVNWLFLDKIQLKEFMIDETIEYLGRFNTFFERQEKYQINDFFNRISIREKEMKDLKSNFTNCLTYSFSKINNFNDFQIEQDILNELEKISIVFLSGHTATSILFFYIKYFKKINLNFQYDTHSVYLQRAISRDELLPEIIILADTLIIDLLNSKKLFKNYKSLLYLWQNQMVMLTSKFNPNKYTSILKGDFFCNIKNNSGAYLAFCNYQNIGIINKTLRAKHNDYEKSLEIVLRGDKSNIVITNDTQARLYSGIKDIKPIKELSFLTENILLYNDEYFSKYTQQKKDKILLTLKYIILKSIEELKPTNFDNFDKIIDYMISDRLFLTSYLKAKSIKLVE